MLIRLCDWFMTLRLRTVKIYREKCFFTFSIFTYLSFHRNVALNKTLFFVRYKFVNFVALNLYIIVCQKKIHDLKQYFSTNNFCFSTYSYYNRYLTYFLSTEKTRALRVLFSFIFITFYYTYLNFCIKLTLHYYYCTITLRYTHLSKYVMALWNNHCKRPNQRRGK